MDREAAIWHTVETCEHHTAAEASPSVDPNSYTLQRHDGTQEKYTTRCEHMNRSSVSVVIPAYNSARYLAKSLDSVMTQTLPPTEILIVDDGSTDNTRTIVAAYRDARIRYIEIPHQGVAAARNRGMELASGYYLAFLDADDQWRPTMLEKQVSILEQDEQLICSFTNFVRFVEETGEVLPEQFDFYPELKTVPVARSRFEDAFSIEGDAFAQLIQFEEIPAFMQCMLFRRTMIADMRQNKLLSRCEDLEFVGRVFLRGKVAFTSEVLTDVRRHGLNLTSDHSFMALDKLRALLPLQNAVDTPSRRMALNDRLVKAWLDAATVLIRADRQWEGLAHYAKIFAIRNSWLRKLKGTARVGYELLNSIGAYDPATEASAQ